MFQKINDFLDKYILPWPVRFLTHRFVILLTMSLLIPLILFAKKTTLVLGLNSYLNTMSVAVSSIVLLYATISEVRQKQIAGMQEKRAQEDHTHVTAIHSLVLETLARQQKEIEELKQMVAAAQGQAYQPKPAAEPVNLIDLHPRGGARFESDDTQKRLKHLHGG